MRKMYLKVESHWGQHTIHPAGSQAPVSDLLRRANLPLNTRCGERGRCDGCMIELISGQLIHSASGRIAQSNGSPITLRGCEYRMGEGGEVSIRIPPRSLLVYEPQVITEFRINVPRAHDPLWQCVNVPADSLDADLPYLAAVADAVARLRDMSARPQIDERFFHTLAAPPRGEWVTLEYRGDTWVITNIADQPTDSAIGVAIDIGTTTVAVMLVDLATGKTLAREAGFNQQMNLGDDVLTRISLCSTPAMLGRLQDAVVNGTIAALVEEALREAKLEARNLRAFSIAGNTTMLHLFAGVDPTPMGVSPFTPRFIEHRRLELSSIWPADSALGKSAPPSAAIHLLPGAAAYVGADLTAGAVASGLLYDEGPSLLVDVGTNGEIIFKHAGQLTGCATAAGPAFEGAGLSSGLRAGSGAISYIAFDADPFAIRTEMIGDAARTAPSGLCGSAYIDFLAQGAKLGFLNIAGRFERDALPGLADFLVEHEGDVGMRIATGQGGRPILVTQRDIANLLQAKAAIAAGILTLLERVKVRPEEIKTVYLAGGFGTHMKREHAIGCGLLPGFRPEQIQPVGNTSLAGALMALLDAGLLREIARVGKDMEIVELNLDPEFESRYIDQLSLPE